MKKFAVTKTKTLLPIVLTLLLAVTGFFAAGSLAGERENDIVAYADSALTSSELSSLGYSFENDYAVTGSGANDPYTYYNGSQMQSSYGRTYSVLRAYNNTVSLLWYTTSRDSTLQFKMIASSTVNTSWSGVQNTADWPYSDGTNSAQVAFGGAAGINGCTIYLYQPTALYKDSSGYVYATVNNKTYYFSSTSGSVAPSTSKPSSPALAPTYTTIPTDVQSAVTTAASLTYTGAGQFASGYKDSYSSYVTYSGTYSGTSAGSYTYTVTPKSGYCWSDGTTSAKTVTWTISKAGIDQATATLSATSFVYTGSGIEPDVTTVTFNGKTLTSGTDYTVSYLNNTDVASDAAVYIAGTGANFSGYKIVYFSITQAKISSANIVLDTSSYTYDGTAKKPEPTLTFGGKALTKDTDYSVSYSNNTNAGTATVTVTGKGNFTGTADTRFTIEAASISSANIELDASSYTYDGTAKMPAPTVKVGSETLTEGTDYTVSYSNNTNAGTATVTVTGKGNYSGTLTKTFTISAADFSAAEVSLGTKAYTYNGSACEPSVTVTLNGVLIDPSDYTVSYSDNTNAGTATVTVAPTGGNVTGDAKTEQFTINKAELTNIVITADGGTSLDVFGGGVALSVTDGAGQTLSATYSADGGVVTIDNANATVTAVTSGEKGHRTAILGSVTVTATVAESDNYSAGKGTVTFATTVKNGFTVTVDGVTTAYENLQDAINAAIESNVGTVKVIGNPTVNETVTILANQKIKIEGESGATLSRADNFTGSIFNIAANAGLEIDSLTLDGKNVAGDPLVTCTGDLTIGGNATIQNGNAVNGGAVYVNGGSLTVESGATFTNNEAQNGGAVYIADGSASLSGTFEGNVASKDGGAVYIASTVTGGKVSFASGAKIRNNKADGAGSGVYIDGISVSVAGDAEGISDGIGINGSAQVSLTGSVTGKFTLEFTDPETQLAGKDADNEYLTDYKNAQKYVVCEDAGIDNQTLASHVTVQNDGYGFDYDKSGAVGGLCLIEETTKVVGYYENGTWETFSSIKEAIQYVKDYGAKDKDGNATGTLYFISHEKDGSYSNVSISLAMTIPEGVHITFESAVWKEGEDEPIIIDGNNKDEYSATVIQRAESLTGALVTVEAGGALTLGYVTLDGGAVWGEDGTADIRIKDDGNGGAGTVTTNNTGVTAHAPVIVNQGTLIITDGATIQNNDNNYAAPGEGFGSQNYGGGVRNEGSGTLVMTGGTIQNCYSREGGAIMNVNKPVKYDDYTANKDDTTVKYYVYGADGTLTALDTSLYGSVQNDGNGYAYVTVNGQKSYVYAGEGCSVTVSGGAITGNVSQQKGAAIQTIYGGATTTVTDSAKIANNWSLHDLGVLSVEEGGSLTVSGGTVSVISGATDLDGNTVNKENAIYLFNQYSAEAYEGYATTPFIEGNGAGKLTITGNPVITGDVHLDDGCNVVDPDTKQASETYYPAYVNVTDYSGDGITVTVSDGYSGEVATSTSSDALNQVAVKTDGAETGNLSGQITYVKEENGSYTLYTGAYDLKVTQTEPGELTITGTVDPAMQSITVQIGEETCTLSKTNGRIDENGNVSYTFNLIGEEDNAGKPATAVTATVTFGYEDVSAVNYIGADGTSTANGLAPTFYLVQFDSATAEITVPEQTTSTDESGNKTTEGEATYYLNKEDEYVLLTSGLLPNDIKIDDDGYATIVIGGTLENGTAAGGDVRQIHIGDRAEEPASADVASTLYDVDESSITIAAADGLEYALAVAATDEDGNSVYEIVTLWEKADSNGTVTFEGLNANTEYFVVVRTPVQTNEEGEVTAIPSEYTSLGEYSTLKDEDITNKNAFDKAYAAIENKLLSWNEETGEWTIPTGTDENGNTVPLLASADSIKEVLSNYNTLSDTLKALPSVEEKYERLLASYAENINESIDEELDAYKDETETVRSELSQIAESYKAAVSGAQTAGEMDDILLKATAALELAYYYYDLTDTYGEKITGDNLSAVEEIYTEKLDEIANATATGETSLEDVLSEIVNDAKEAVSLSAVKSVAIQDYLDAYKAITGEAADSEDATVAEIIAKIEDATGETTEGNVISEINGILLDAVKELVNGMLIYETSEDGEPELQDSEATEAFVNEIVNETDGSLKAAVSAANGQEVADLSAVVRNVKANIEGQRSIEKQAATSKIDEAAADVSDLSGENQVLAERCINAAKEEIQNGNYVNYERIVARVTNELALIKNYDSLLKESAGLSDSGKAVLAEQFEEALKTLDDAYESGETNVKLSELVTALTTEAGIAIEGEKFLDAHPVLRKNFDDIFSDDGDALAAVLEEAAGLSQDVQEYLNEAARILNEAEQEEWYSSFASFIEDEINKSQFEQKKEEIISQTEQLVKEDDGENVLAVLEAQKALINAVDYEPCTDDGDRIGHAQGKSEELETAGATARTEIEHAQVQQRTVNSAIEEFEELIADNRYNDKQKEELQKIIDELEIAVSGVSSSGGDGQTAEEILDGLLADAKKDLGEVPVSAVITGGIRISDDGSLTTSDGTGDYGEQAEEKIWGVVTNDSSIPSDVLLVIEETNGDDAMKAIDSAADSGNLVAADENTELDKNSLADLVSGKEIKATLDIYLLKENARYEEFEGVYVVKVLMPSEWRNYQGLQVVYVGDDGTVEVFETKIEEGRYLVFSTTHFSEFYILGEKDVNLWWLIITLSVVLAIELIAIVAVLVKRKKQNGDGNGDKSEKVNAFAPLGTLLAVVVPGGAVAACIVLGVCVVGAGAMLAVLALKKKRAEEATAECAPEEIPSEQDAPMPEENTPEEQSGEISEAAVAADTVAAAETVQVFQAENSAELTQIIAVSGEEESETVYDPVARRYIVIKYNKSFLAKLIQADDETKSYYAVLKNEIMSYGAKSRISWRHESFRYGKTLLIKMRMRGKTLCLHYALSASDYAGSKYKVEDYSEVHALQTTPCLYRIKNDRRCKYAKELIADVMKKYGSERGEEQDVSYAAELPYEDTEALVARGLVKKLTDEEAQSGTQFRPVEVRHEVKASEVDDILSDAVAKELVENAVRYADKTKTGIINVDTISRFFKDGETVTLEEIKKRVPEFSKKITYVKVLARGTLDKALTVEADDFSIEAVKMILLTGGKAKRTLVKAK